MKKMHLFMVKFLSPTNINGSRIKITSALYNKSKIISYDYQGRTDEQAAA